MNRDDPRPTVEALRAGGLVAAEEEAAELVAAAMSDAALASMVARRLLGEPTAWITGRAPFLGLDLHIEPGLYVPRWKSEAIAVHAAGHLPPHGTAVDLCTGSGAVAAYLAARHPTARVVAVDIDPAAVACARRNGVEAFVGDLYDALPPGLAAAADVVSAVPPYVPRHALRMLPPDVAAYEPARAHDGGADGLAVVGRIVDAAPAGAHVVVELGIDQVDAVAARLDLHEVLYDGDGDPCGVCMAPRTTKSSMRS